MFGVVNADSPCPSGQSQLIVNYNAQLKTGLLYSLYGLRLPLINLDFSTKKVTLNSHTLLNPDYKWLSGTTKQWQHCLPNNNSYMQYTFNGAIKPVHFWMIPNETTTINIESTGIASLSTKAVVTPDQTLIKIAAENITKLSDLTAANIISAIKSSPSYQQSHPLEIDIKLSGDDTIASTIAIPQNKDLSGYLVTRIVVDGKNNKSDVTVSSTAGTTLEILQESPVIELDNINFTGSNNVFVNTDLDTILIAKNDSFSDFNKVFFRNLSKARSCDSIGLTYAVNCHFDMSEGGYIVRDIGNLVDPFSNISMLVNPSIKITKMVSQFGILSTALTSIGILKLDARVNKLSNPNYYFLKNEDSSKSAIQNSLLYGTEMLGLIVA